MRVLVGNKRPKVGHKLPNGQMVYDNLPEGEYVTEVRADDLTQIVGALTFHFFEGDKPTWVSCEDFETEIQLVQCYGIQRNQVPEEWRLNENS